MTATSTVAVLGASGQTGRRVLAALDERGVATRAVTRQSAAPASATEAAKADLADPGSVRAALEGAAAVYIVAPAFHPEEDRIVADAAAAAADAGVGRIVLHSVLHPHTPRMPHHMRKAAAEDAVRRAGVPWTILQPAMYVQTVVGMLRPGAEEIPLVWSASAPMTPVHLGDIAEVAATVLIQDGHAAASYELAGPETLGLGEMIAQAGAVTGRELRTFPVDPAQIAPRIADNPQHAAELTAMFTEYGNNGLVGNSRVLAWLLGREPTRFADAVRADLGLPV